MIRTEKKKDKDLVKIILILQKHFGYSRKTTLNRMRKNPHPFKILVSCLLSLRTRDENTEKISEKLFKIASTPEAILKLPTKKLEKIIYSSGHYKKKAKILKHVSREILEKHAGKVPESESELLAIKGVGRKTMNIVRCFAFNKTTIPVDINVHRIANRLGVTRTKNADETEKELIKLLPKKYWKEINGLFVLHGKNICVPVSPLCSKCPVSEFCSRTNVTKSR